MTNQELKRLSRYQNVINIIDTTRNLHEEKRGLSNWREQTEMNITLRFIKSNFL